MKEGASLINSLNWHLKYIMVSWLNHGLAKSYFMKNNSPSTNIFSDLIRDHDHHRNMLVKIHEAFEDQALCKQLFAQFSLEVKAHASAEEQALYGPIMTIPEYTAGARHSVAEHKGIEDLINQLADESLSHKKWIAHFTTLQKDYLHHIDEEEDELFPKLLRELSAEKQQSMGAIFEKRKPIEKSAATVGEGEEEGEEC